MEEVRENKKEKGRKEGESRVGEKSLLGRRKGEWKR